MIDIQFLMQKKRVVDIWIIEICSIISQVPKRKIDMTTWLYQKIDCQEDFGVLSFCQKVDALLKATLVP